MTAISAAQAGRTARTGTCYRGTCREPCSLYVPCSLYAMQLTEDQKFSSSEASCASLRAVTHPHCPTCRVSGNTTQQHAHSPTLEGLLRERKAFPTALQQTGQINHIALASPETLIFSLSAPLRCAGISPMEVLIFLPLCSGHTDPVRHRAVPRPRLSASWRRAVLLLPLAK